MLIVVFFYRKSVTLFLKKYRSFVSSKIIEPSSGIIYYYFHFWFELDTDGIQEIGTHILVCAVSYTTQGGEKMYFRKFFKFQVLNLMVGNCV